MPDLYADSLVTQGAVTQEELTNDMAAYNAVLSDELKAAENCVPQTSYLEGRWKGLVQASPDKVTTWDTGESCTVIACAPAVRMFSDVQFQNEANWCEARE